MGGLHFCMFLNIHALSADPVYLIKTRGLGRMRFKYPPYGTTNIYAAFYTLLRWFWGRSFTGVISAEP